MINRLRFFLSMLVVFLSAYACVHAFVETTTLLPNDPFFRTPYYRGKWVEVGVAGMYSERSTGRTVDGQRRNVLMIYDDTQSILAMLRDAVGDMQPKAQAALNSFGFAPPLVDDGKRGRISMQGTSRSIDVNLWMRGYFPEFCRGGRVGLSAFLPVRRREINVRSRQNLTPKNTVPEVLLAHYIDDLDTQLTSLSNLSIGSYSTTDAGDLVLRADVLYAGFPSETKAIKQFLLLAHLGLSVPTGKKRHEDKALSMPLGTDGAWGMPIGVGVEIDCVKIARFGLYGDVLYLFNKKRVRRLKTSEQQTEFLLINKAAARKEHGLTWQFEAFAQAYRFWLGCSARVAYRFAHHAADTLTTSDANFSEAIINTAKNLQGWTLHTMLFDLSYEFLQPASCCAPGPQARGGTVVPYIGIFANIALDGKAIIDQHAVGARCGVGF